jgi:hypothetical protein
MKQLMHLRLFSIVEESSQGTKCQTKLRQAYDEFVEKLSEKLENQTDYSKMYSDLSFIRLELIGLQDNLSDEVEKKCHCNFKQDYFIN